jgi:hypothetical protein
MGRRQPDGAAQDRYPGFAGLDRVLEPVEFAAQASVEGRAWIAALPALVDRLCRKWRLQVEDGVAARGYTAWWSRSVVGLSGAWSSSPGRPSESLTRQGRWPPGGDRGPCCCWKQTQRSGRCCWSGWTQPEPWSAWTSGPPPRSRGGCCDAWPSQPRRGFALCELWPMALEARCTGDRSGWAARCPRAGLLPPATWPPSWARAPVIGWSTPTCTMATSWLATGNPGWLSTEAGRRRPRARRSGAAVDSGGRA